MLARFVGCVILAALGSAQELKVAPVLKAGDVFALEVTRTRENTARPAQNSKVVTPVEVRVVSAGADGSVLEWIPGESRSDSGQALKDPLVRAAATAAGGVVLRLRLNGAGEFDGLVNEADVIAQVRKGTDIIVQGVMATVPEAQRASFQQLLGQVLSPMVLVAAVTRDVQTYFNLNGVALTAGETVSVSIDQPNPLGGPPIAAAFRMTLESSTADTATITTSTAYDGAALARMTRSILEKGGKPVSDADLAQVQMQMADDGRFLLDRRTGLMKDVVVSRRVTAGKEQRLDGWDIRLIRTPQR